LAWGPRNPFAAAGLSEYLDGELPVKDCRQLERHLKGCRPCIAYLESLKTTVEACRRFKAPRAPALSKQVNAALLAAVRQAISTYLSE
jgi:anti-sigma factor RsiW